ncbi:MAG: type II secretion system F family protein [Gammaproteobacteria bacterium]|nr:type II secretion system F family protein [Gammaproteobacteria bacterium]MXY30709.1 type II secretion system F family protein [Gammaproteobacteria bacterium]MYC98991.1 type II secretion system F family protein [Gammaproteobacteria bacterium]MYF60126.1 type II secretion system F family protein [Gammaproteobacteria bacterium]
MPSRDIAVFARQFATMIQSGLSLAPSLGVLAEQAGNRRLAAVVGDVRHDIEAGRTLAGALGEHPAAFNQLFVSMVAAGEAGGVLDTVLARLADSLERTDRLARKVRGALIYPAVVVVVAACALLVLLEFVIPTFQEMFAASDLPLPLPTRMVIGLSESLRAFWWLPPLFTAGAWVGWRRARATPRGRLILDRLLLASPVVGPLCLKMAMVRFARTLGTLVASGVAILEALEITAASTGNRVVHDAVMNSRRSIAGGNTIAEPLRASGIFPPMVLQMIHVGEQTGGLDEMLAKIADFYDDETGRSIEALLAAFEPAMVTVLGVVVGGMIVSMYLPIFDMINVVG